MRKTALPFYALIFLTELVWMAIVPLAPTYAEHLSLTKVQLGTVLAAAGVATLVVSLPIGLLADRVGTRTLTAGSSALVALSSLGQGLAGDYWSLLFSRAAFGVALGTIWTAGLAWASEMGPRDRSPSSLGVPVTVAGFGIVVGPAFAGLMAHAFGVRAPFLVLAGASAVVTVALVRGTAHESTFHPQPLVEMLRGARRDRVVVASAAVWLLVGALSGGVNLLVPLELRRNGLSSGATGLVFSASSVIFVLASAFVARLGARVVTLRAVGVAALLYAASMLLAVAGSSTGMIVAFLLVRSPFWAALATLAYPLGALGAQRAGLGRGAVMGLLNLVWGAAGSLSPVAAGAIAEGASERWAFGALLICSVGVGICLLAGSKLTDVEPAASFDTA